MVKIHNIQSLESFLAKASLENLQLMMKNLQGGVLQTGPAVQRKEHAGLKAGKDGLKDQNQTAEETIKHSIQSSQKSKVNREKAYSKIFDHLSKDGQLNDGKLSDQKIMQMLDGVDITPKEWAVLVPGSPLVQGELEKRELSDDEEIIFDQEQDDESGSESEDDQTEQDSEFEPCEKEFTVKSVLVKF